MPDEPLSPKSSAEAAPHAAEGSEWTERSEDRYKAIFDESNTVMLIIDPDDSAIVDANAFAVRFYGWPKDRLIGKRMSEVNTLPPEVLREKIRMAMRGERGDFSFEHRVASGETIPVEVRGSPITIGGKSYLLSIVKDIRKRVQAEAERDALALKLGHYLSTSPTITYSMALEGGVSHYAWISENVETILGYPREKALEPDWWFGSVHPSDRANALNGVAALVKNGRFAQEYRFVRGDRSIVWLRDEMRLVKGVGGESEIVGTLTDVSERKRAEAEIGLKSAALEAADNAVLITDRNGLVEWSNAAFGLLSGYERDEIKGREIHELVNSGEQGEQFYHDMMATIMNGKVWRGELVNRRKSGEFYHEEMTITPVLDGTGQVAHYIAVKSDITERIKTSEKLEASLREKEALIREVHHRVKNNMQIISSLLSLQAGSTGEGAQSDIMGEALRRIEAMAIVHELFYQSSNVARIDLGLTLQRMTEALAERYCAESLCPEFEFGEGLVPLTIDEAIPVSLIASELVSNAIRHAFKGRGEEGRLWIAVRQDGDSMSLDIRDDGIGLPPGFDPEAASTLGMRLITLLAQQLRGRVTFTSEAGTRATLRFPISGQR